MKLGRIGSLTTWICVLAISVVAGGCSSFEGEWRRSGHTSFSPNTIAGPWEGTWRSEVTDHSDQLRCLITPRTNNACSARFHAKYKRLLRFSFGYTVPLAVYAKEEGFQFEGEADLGWYAGGTYRYMGFATPTNFFSTYQSKYDHGTFQMSRPRRSE